MTTVFQTRHWQEQIVAGAAKAGELHLLYYMIEMQLPEYIAKKIGQRRLLAQNPVGYIPVVNLAPDPDAAYVTIQLLQKLLVGVNRDWLTDRPSKIEFRILLVYKDDIPTSYWYEWWPGWEGPVLPTHTVDRICADCGGISQVQRDKGWTCCTCGMQHDEEGVVGVGGRDDGQDAQVGEERRGAHLRDLQGTSVVLVPGWHEGRESRRGYYLPLSSASAASAGMGADSGSAVAL